MEKGDTKFTYSAIVGLGFLALRASREIRDRVRSPKGEKKGFRRRIKARTIEEIEEW